VSQRFRVLLEIEANEFAPKRTEKRFGQQVRRAVEAILEDNTRVVRVEVFESKKP
jgi:hypothetical protein